MRILKHQNQNMDTITNIAAASQKSCRLERKY